ncbi:MAG: 4'-phosphopantetheinyl transferase superfamily protein [Desulfobacteraceae bacterium]|nr:4'-phosphopantetheinyl transferase superfamily protein [Desulfobacteraceae bacterium]
MIIILYPYISKVPGMVQALPGKERTAALSRLARECAAASALRSGLDIGAFETGESGVPLPFRGVFWSLSHKPDYVAGVVSTKGVGIDIEMIKPISEALFRKIVDETEALLFPGRDRGIIFFRVFTAKEAVLKKAGVGMRGLSKAKIHEVWDDRNLLIRYLDKKYQVEHFYFDGYLASVTKDNLDIEWRFR